MEVFNNFESETKCRILGFSDGNNFVNCKQVNGVQIFLENIFPKDDILREQFDIYYSQIYGIQWREERFHVGIGIQGRRRGKGTVAP